MDPTIAPGSLVVAFREPTYSVGDVVVYAIPVGQPGAGRLVVHRIVES